MTSFILGVDMAKSSFELHVLDLFKPKKSSSFPNNKKGMEAMLSSLPQGDFVLGVESTSTYHLELVEWAHEQGWTVFVLNPARVKANGETISPTHKTDSIDAWAIAEFVRQKRHLLRPWQPELEAWSQVRALSRRRACLMKMRRQEANRLEALPSRFQTCERSIKETLTFFDGQLEALEQDLTELFETHQELSNQVELLKTIPCVGPVLAATLSGELGALGGYEQAKDLTARAGLVPFAKASGTSVHGNGRIRHTGNAKIRRVLYMAAMGAFRSEMWSPWISRRLKNGKTGRKLMIAIMDKLLRLCFGVIRTGRPFDPKIAFSS